MRTIKFRAWDLDCGVMRDWEWIRKCEFPFYSEAGGVDLLSKEFVLMQYTGLKDKNGGEIYERDILGRTTDKNFVFVVDFSDGSFSGVTEPGRVHRLSLEKAMNLERSPYVEIIGNIYENPELITQ